MGRGYRIAIGVLVWAGGCGTASVVDYRAEPAVREQDWGELVHVERAGVRVLAGPAAVFPYVKAPGGGGSEPERGRYELFTRVVVESTGADSVEVLWGSAELEGWGGEVVPLLDAAAADAAGAGGAGGASVEWLAPGERTVRALIPATVREIGVGEPMVALCDGCVYRLIVPVRIGGRAESLGLAFRMVAERRTVRSY